jgi:hypothetical protein
VAHQHAHSAYHHPVPERLAQEKPHSIKILADDHKDSFNSLLNAFRAHLISNPLGDEQLRKHNGHLRRKMRRIHGHGGQGAFDRLAFKECAFSFHFRLREKEVMRIVDPILF